MSQACERYFVQESCFYECDPHVGLYTKYNETQISDPDYNTWQIVGMPIKKSYCDGWFDACKNDYLCGADFFECADPNSVATPETPSSDPVSEPASEPSSSKPCFSAKAEVQVKGVGAVRMDALKIGDSILTSNNEYSKVFTFGHYSPQGKMDVVEIRTTNMDNALEISPQHMLYVNNKLVPASQVQVGDVLTSANGRVAEVQSVRTVNGVKGVYAPHTMKGHLVVNGVVASNYIALPALEGATFEIQAYLQHLAMGPYRKYCTTVGCENETYSFDGRPSAVTFWDPVLSVIAWIVSNSSTLLVTVTAAYLYANSNKAVDLKP